MELSRDPSASAPVRPARAEFDEDGYLQLHPDIAAGVARGAIASGWSHFFHHGHAEGRAWIAQSDRLAGVVQEIAVRDEMFTGNREHYLEVGESALRCVETALMAAQRPRSTVKRILDLPCGHGRVMRFLRQAFPAAELVACDLNRDGVDFCAQAFGAVSEYSDEQVDLIPHEGVVDLIWCGSLLTHLPEAKWRDFLNFFHRILGHRGLLVFTTHGRYCAREFVSGRNRHGLTDPQVAALLRAYEATGFSYIDYADQSRYGFSLAHPAFVTTRLLDEAQWRLLVYNEAGWDRRQDVVVVQKSLAGLAVGI